MKDSLQTTQREPTSIVEKFVRFHRRDVELMERAGNTPFGSSFWCVVRLRNAIKFAAKMSKGTLLDVGCGKKPYESDFRPFVERHIGVEYSPESVYRDCRADFFGDAMHLPMPDASVDTLLCTEVLEHLPDPEKAIAEFSRVLKPDGILITTAPFFYPIHDAWDFFRYSPDGLSAIMQRSGLEVELVKPLSGSAVTVAMMFNLYWFDIGFMWTKWLYPIGLVLRPLLMVFCLIVNVVGRLFESLIPSNQMSFNHLTIARKS